MFCLKCGKEIENGAKFCPYCGAVTAAGSTPSAPESPAHGQAEGGSTFDWSFPAQGGKKRRGAGLIIGGAAAVVLVVALAIAAVGGLFSSPKGQVEKALGKTAAAYASAKDGMGIPDLAQLIQGRSYSQRVSLMLGGVSQEMAGGYYDLSALKGLGVRMDMDYDQKGRKMDADLAVFLDEEDLASIQMLVDGGKMYFTSPDFTKGDAYGFNTETIGADLSRLGAENGEMDIKKIGFNIFDLVEKSVPSDQQTKEMEKAVAEANKQLLDALEVEKGGKQGVEVNGKNVDATVYHVLVAKDAMKDYINALEDAMKMVDTKAVMKDMLSSIGFDKGAVNEILAEMGNADPYGELASQLKQAVKALGDVELEVYISGGYLSAVEYSDRINGSKVEVGLYLGGGGNYVDNLSLEIAIDGEKLTVESNGDHAGKSGVFTDETTVRVGGNRLTSELRYEPKAESSNLEWEMKVDNTASVTVEGQLTTAKDSIDLQIDDLSVKAAGVKLISLEGKYYLGPCKGMEVSVSSPKMLGDMDKDDLMDLYYDIMENAQDWAYDLQNRIPSELLYYFF